jgi:hypothetical protein
MELHFRTQLQHRFLTGGSFLIRDSLLEPRPSGVLLLSAQQFHVRFAAGIVLHLFKLIQSRWRIWLQRGHRDYSG